MSINFQRSFVVGFGASTLACGLLQWAGVTDDWNLWLSILVFVAVLLAWWLIVTKREAK